ncbi:DUF2341 domain-containing protein, partial [Candidatus Parvarchaeota archaeon]|nr:DUF2341 domain-containing protein [Candidatus Parvarchaeota archaeon]
MNNKAQMITIFFSLFLILAIITILGIESANLNTNENVNSLIQAYNLPKLEYYNFLNVMSKISTINPSNATAAVFNSTIEGIYSKFFQNINITNQGVNTSSLVISNFAESIPLLITNYQNIATPNPFQQMINISVSSIDNYVNTTSFGQNVEFIYDNNSVIPSWLESYNSKYAIWWIKIPSIPAKGTITIYMKFANKKTNLFNNKTTGEAPQLSPTYAEYDDGANVFDYYENFAGSGLPAGWQELTSSGDTYTWNNGITFTNNGHNDYVSIGTTSAVASAGILELDVASGSNARPTIELAATDTQIEGGQPIYEYEEGYGQSYGMYSGDMQLETLTTSSISTANSKTAYNAPLIEGISWTGTGSELLEIIPNYLYNNMETVQETSTSVSLSTPLYIMLGQAASGSSSDTGGFTANWLRVRAYPPNGVMPTVQILNAPANIGYIAPLTITNHQNVATPNPFQQEVVINASRYSALEAPNLDNIEFFYSNGTIIPSWLESGNSSSENATYWLKVGSIPANSSINAYIGFASTNLNLFNGKTVGEAPQLSPTYAEYDDGADVFNVYSNFAGTSLPSDFTSYVGD